MNEEVIKNTLEKGFQIHMGIAEQGKVHALEGNHQRALLYYRTAINMTVAANDPEVFFRHYLECALESMEHLSMLDDLMDYCDKALKIYENNPPPNQFARMDNAYLHQKKAIILMKMDKKQEAIDYFKKAIALAKEEKAKLSLSETLLRWLSGGFFIDQNRMITEQYKQGYFNVRKDTVDPSKAITLPDEDLFPYDKNS